MDETAACPAPDAAPAGPARPPRAELHLHLEGTLEPELAFELAERNGVVLPFADVEELRSAYDFSDLQSFLDLYYANMSVLRTADDFADLTRAYLRRAAVAGVRHAEIMFDPQAHLLRGVPLETVMDGIGSVLATSEREFGLSTLLIAAFLRDRPAGEALSVLERLLATGAPIAAVGLDSAEVGSAAPFAPVFARAAAAGLRRTAHAGEEGPPSNVVEVLDVLGAERIDHGIRAMEDPALVARLAADRVPLTVCPLSNVRLKAVPSLAAHPLPWMVESGLHVSVHSDDPAYFGGHVDDVDDALTVTFGLGPRERAALAAASFTGSFLPPEQVRMHLREVEEWAAAAELSVGNGHANR